jgi:hypothetical protein
MVAFQAGKTREDEAGSFTEEPNASSASSNRLAEVYDFAGITPEKKLASQGAFAPRGPQNWSKNGHSAGNFGQIDTTVALGPGRIR